MVHKTIIRPLPFSMTRLFGMLVVLLVGLLLVSTLFIVHSAEPSIQEAPAAIEGSPLLPLTETVKEKIRKSVGFEFLVSYTARGFEPKELVVPKGKTVRFVNNSTEPLWVAASGTPMYPGTPNGCGVSELDSCMQIVPNDFWEFTFKAPGEWNVRNILRNEDGVVFDVR